MMTMEIKLVSRESVTVFSVNIQTILTHLTDKVNDNPVDSLQKSFPSLNKKN